MIIIIIMIIKITIIIKMIHDYADGNNREQQKQQTKKMITMLASTKYSRLVHFCLKHMIQNLRGKAESLYRDFSLYFTVLWLGVLKKVKLKKKFWDFMLLVIVTHCAVS